MLVSPRGYQFVHDYSVYIDSACNSNFPCLYLFPHPPILACMRQILLGFLYYLLLINFVLMNGLVLDVITSFVLFFISLPVLGLKEVHDDS